MTPPVDYRRFGYVFKLIGPFIMLYLLEPYFGKSPWKMFFVALIPGAFLGATIEKIHNVIRYRALGDDYFVDRLSGKVWCHGYSNPNPWDSGWYWYSANITEQEAINRLINRKVEE